MRGWCHWVAGLAAIVVADTTAVAAAQDTQRFDVYLLGVRAGRIAMSSVETERSYAVRAQMSSVGILKSIADFVFEGEVQGRLSGTAPRPDFYRERFTLGDDEETKSMRYRAGVPDLTSSASPERHWLAPEDQAGALDPLTMMWELLRNRNEAEFCSLNAVFFDGVRRGQVIAQTAGDVEGQKTCSGAYERLGGFTSKELRSGTRFPFTLFYEDRDGVLVPVRMDMRSTRGRAQIIRR